MRFLLAAALGLGLFASSNSASAATSPKQNLLSKPVCQIEPGHLPQGTPSNGSQVGSVAEAVFQHGAQSSGQELGQVADPGTNLIMSGGLDVHSAATKALHPGSPIGGQRVGGKLGKQPHGMGEKPCVGMGGAAYFFARHGVPGKKACLARASKQRLRAFGDGHFDAADVCHQLMRLKPRSEPLHPVLNGEYGATEKDEVAVCGCNHRIFGGNIDCAPVQGYLRWRGVTVPADDLTWKAGCAERQPGGSADEARADDHDAIDGHCKDGASPRLFRPTYPGFLSRLVALSNFMRLSLMKVAHAALSCVA